MFGFGLCFLFWWTWRFFKCTAWYSCLLGRYGDVDVRMVAGVRHAQNGDELSALSFLGVGSVTGYVARGGAYLAYCAAFVTVLRLCLLMLRACWVGFVHAPACFLVCVFSFCRCPGRSVSLFLSLFLLPSLCLSSLPQHYAVIEESSQIQPSSICIIWIYVLWILFWGYVFHGGLIGLVT